MTNEVSRRASLNQGKCFIRVALEAFGDKISTFQILSNIIQHKKLSNSHEIQIYGHYSVIFGISCKLLNISWINTLKVYFRIIIRDIINSACRLNLIGPLEGSKIQAEFTIEIESTIKEILRKEESVNEKPIQISPFYEIIQARHDLLYSRLFNS